MNRPSRSDYYLMQVAHILYSIYRALHNKWFKNKIPAVKFDKMAIKFNKHKEEQLTAEEYSRRALQMWAVRLGTKVEDMQRGN